MLDISSRAITRITGKIGVQQVARIDVEGEREALDVLNRQVAQPPLDGTDVGSVQRGPIRQFLLREATRHAHEPNISREEVLKVLGVGGAESRGGRSLCRESRRAMVSACCRSFR